MQASEFNNLNNFNLANREAAFEAVHSILNPKQEEIREIKRRGGKNIAKIQRDVLAQEVNKRTDKLANQVKEIKSLKTSVGAYEQKLTKLDVTIGQLQKQVAEGKSDALPKLQELEKQRNQIKNYVAGMQDYLIKSKKEWQSINAGLTHFKHAVNYTEDKQLMSFTAKLDKIQSEAAAQFQEIHHEKKDWSLLSDVERKLLYNKSFRVIDFITGRKGKSKPLNDNERAVLRSEQKKIIEFLRKDNLHPDVRARAALLNGKIAALLATGIYILDL